MLFIISNVNVYRFSFENVNSPGYWSLLGVNVTVQGETFAFKELKIGAPLDFSYHCSQEVIFNDGHNNKFNISSDFQVPCSCYDLLVVYVC
jgi:hypothetical protein